MPWQRNLEPSASGLRLELNACYYENLVRVAPICLVVPNIRLARSRVWEHGRLAYGLKPESISVLRYKLGKGCRFNAENILCLKGIEVEVHLIVPNELFVEFPVQ